MEKKKRHPYREASSRNKTSDSWLRYAGLASEMMVMLGGAAFLGYKADQWLEWEFPILLIIFPFIALTVLLWRLIKATGRKDG